MTSAPRTRLSPDARRAQLLDLGVRLLATRPVDEISIDLLAEEAGISRGLLYHYFGSLQGFHEAVVRRAADDLIARTAPPAGEDARERLHASVAAYVDYVAANREGYLSLVKGSASGNPVLRGIHEEARAALTERIFLEDDTGMLADNAVSRLVVRGWSALAEEVVLAWLAEPGRVGREQIVDLLAGSLPLLVGASVDPDAG